MGAGNAISDFAHRAVNWAASPVGQLARVELFVTFCCVVLAIAAALSARRRSMNKFLSFLVWAACMGSYPLASYTIGLMQSANYHSQLSVVWACFLLLLLGSADSVASFRLDVDGQQKQMMFNQGVKSIYVLLLLANNVAYLNVQLKVLMFIIWGAGVAQLVHKARTFMSDASRKHVLIKENKIISDYMEHEHEIPQRISNRTERDWDDLDLTGYKYIVTGEVEQKKSNPQWPAKNWATSSNKLVTVDQVCDAVNDPYVKIICIGFALFKLLRRRLGHGVTTIFPLYEAKHLKTRKLIFILYEYVFAIAEIELGFLFDFFYGRIPSPTESILTELILFLIILSSSLATLFCSSMLRYSTSSSELNIFIGGHNVDIGLTRFTIVLFILLETWRLLSLVTSDWNMVKMLTNEVQRSDWDIVKNEMEFPLWLWVLNKVGQRIQPRYYWKRALDQHNLLYDAYNQTFIQWWQPWEKISQSREIYSEREYLTVFRVLVGEELVIPHNSFELMWDGRYTLLKFGMWEKFGWVCKK